MVAVVVTVVAFVVAGIASVVQGWIPVGDEALMELRVRDIPSHLPLLGPWSRFGWNHPGPAQFYFLAPFYWLGGRSSVSLLVGTLCMNLLFTVLAWWIVRQINQLIGLLVLLSSVALLVSSDPVWLRNPWNPYVVTVGGLLLCAAAWSLSERRSAGALALFPVGSFIIQAHVVTAPFVVAVCLAGLILTISNRSSPMPWKPLCAGTVLAVAIWLPPLIQQVTGEPGNLGEVIRLGGGGSGPAIGIIGAMRVASHASAVVPGVLRPVATASWETRHWVLPFWILAFLVALGLAIKGRDSIRIRGAVVASAGMLGAVSGVAFLKGGSFSYLMYSLRPAAMMMIVVTVAVVADRQAFVARERLGIMAASLTIALAPVLAIQQIGAENPFSSYGPAVRTLVDGIEVAGPSKSIQVEDSPPHGISSVVATGVLVQLEHMGYRTIAPVLGEYMVGQHRLGPPAQYVVKVAPLDSGSRLEQEGWRILAAVKDERAALVLVGRPVANEN